MTAGALLLAMVAQVASPAGAPPRPPMVETLLDRAPQDAALAKRLAALGMSAAGIAVVRDGAVAFDTSRLAAAEQRIARAAAETPLDLAALRIALEVRDSIAAELARMRSARLITLLGALSAKDRAVFLRVFGTDTTAPAPSR